MRRETPARLKECLFEALRAAGALIRRNFGRPQKISFKNGSAINLVTVVDQQADALIRRTIEKRFPNHDFLTEELAATQRRSDYKWIVDPLDGTTNFAHQFPQVCVSIGLELRGRVILGGVFDPLRDELFWAERGRGAFLRTGRRQTRIRVSPTPALSKSLLMTGFPYDRLEKADFYLSYVKAFMARNQGIRRAGAAALDLCWIACGRVDGYWEWRLKPWDCAAGKVIVEEAGGRLSDFSGNAYTIYGEQTLATNGKIHGEMLKVMRTLQR
jgi:myo-inositol-1(or 4)-monophosphatase